MVCLRQDHSTVSERRSNADELQASDRRRRSSFNANRSRHVASDSFKTRDPKGTCRLFPYLRFLFVLTFVAVALYGISLTSSANPSNEPRVGVDLVDRLFNPWATKNSNEPYIAGFDTKIDPNAPGNDDKELFARNDDARVSTIPDLGPAPHGSAQALAVNAETLLQGAAFGDLPTATEKLAKENSTIAWDAPDEKSWGDDTSLEGFQAIARTEYVALNDNANDGFLPRTLKEHGKLFSSIPMERQKFSNVNAGEEKTYPRSEDDGALKNAIGAKNNNLNLADAATTKLTPIVIPPNYRANGSYVDTGVETLGQGTTPF